MRFVNHPGSNLLAIAIATTLAMAACGGSSNTSNDSGAYSTSGHNSGSSSGHDGGSSSGPTGGTPGVSLGDTHTGIFNYGPVDWAQTQWHNACAGDDGYPSQIETLEGTLLAGVSNVVGTPGPYCDACVEITSTNGRSLIARVVTYGVLVSAGDLDLSPEAYNALYTNENSRNMSWQLVTCPGTDPLYFQFLGASSSGWSKLWIRNPRVAVAKLEVKSTNHPNFTSIPIDSDGGFNDSPRGFGNGAFTLRVTGIDGSTFEQSFDSYPSGKLVAGSGNL
ncbi:MAG: hypothetical protein FWD73_09360 [Polyangiaceae bacterium]|nr:hypothetical protein [Polyangiaceae bacterium]